MIHVRGRGFTAPTGNPCASTAARWKTGELEKAVAAGFALEVEGYNVANKATTIQATYLEKAGAADADVAHA